MPRVYERRFDWEEAARLYLDGLTLTQIAERFGVVHEAVRNSLVKQGIPRRPPNNVPTSVRPGTLRCVTCREWKPDEEFPRNAGENKARRGRHRHCRSCAVKARTAYRARHREEDNAYWRARARRLGTITVADCDEHDRCRGCGVGRLQPSGAARKHRASCPLRAEARAA